MTFGVITSTTNNGPAVTTSTTQNVTPLSSGGFSLGQSPTDLISFYGAPGVAQGAAGTGVTQQLVNMGLIAAGSSGQNAPIANGTGSTLTTAQGAGQQLVLLNSLTGSTNTLPAATGSGAKFRFRIQVQPTSGSIVIKAASNLDYMIGNILTIDAGAVTGYVAVNSGTVSTNSDTVTLNRTTTGAAAVGDYIEFEDVANNTWAVNGVTTATGTAATPFSAGV